MKKLVAASVALMLIAGSVSAASVQTHERPDTARSEAVSAQSVKKVPAQSIYSNKELSRRHLTANDVVEVTVFPSTGVVDAPSQDN